MDNLRLYVGTETYKVGNAPVGLLVLLDGTVICKSEYRTDDNRCECTIVESGERYYGNGDEAECKHLLIGAP